MNTYVIYFCGQQVGMSYGDNEGDAILSFVEDNSTYQHWQLEAFRVPLPTVRSII